MLKDNTERYGSVTRGIHWLMALLLLWQFCTAGAHFLFADTQLEEWLWPTHKPMGFLLFLLIAIRIVWALANLNQRPAAVNVAAKLGHLALYGLLFAVPALALLRQYGSGRAFEPFGLSLMTGHSDKITWMIEPGNLLHSTLGWLLLASIVGHVLMAIVHRKSAAHVDVLPRMWR